VTYLPVDQYGLVDLDELQESITDKTILISLMMVNNETGVIFDISQIGEIARLRGVFFHTDATQAVGKLPIDVKAMKIDLLSMSGHKIYGPKGVGALYVSDRKPRVRPMGVIYGGGQENGMRSGTLNVPGIVGMGKACEVCSEVMAEESQRLKKLGDKLYHGIMDRINYVTLNGHPEKRAGHVLNLGFAYVESESLMLAMRDVAVSSGSACTSESLEPSYILRAMGTKAELANGSLRFSLGRYNTEEEVDFVVEQLAGAVGRTRAMSPLYDEAKKEKTGDKR